MWHSHLRVPCNPWARFCSARNILNVGVKQVLLWNYRVKTATRYAPADKPQKHDASKKPHGYIYICMGFPANLWPLNTCEYSCRSLQVVVPHFGRSHRGRNQAIASVRRRKINDPSTSQGQTWAKPPNEDCTYPTICHHVLYI